MSGRTPPCGDAPSWATAFEALRPALVAYLRRRGLGWIADDVIAKVALELAHQDRRGTSRKDDEAALHGLVWTMLKFRARDELRRRFVNDIAGRVGEALIDGTPDEPSGELSDRIDAKRFLVTVAAEIEKLGDEDRRLIMRDVEGGDGRAMNGKDRVRLFRLRRHLAGVALENSKGKGGR